MEIDDIKLWKTAVFGIGTYDRLADLNIYNLSLNIIGSPVAAFGSISGRLQGEIAALFYRYKSVGGYEYAADFLIGPRSEEQPLLTKHGDSGTLWLLEAEDAITKKTTYLPIAVQWGRHRFTEVGKRDSSAYALGTCLSNVLRRLDVDLVRDWNIDQDYSWGKLGHFSIANLAVDAVTNAKLKDLMTNNLELITFSFDNLTIAKIDKGLKLLKQEKNFVPLADVPDLVWKSKVAGIKRGKEGPNHFADMDKKDSKGKTLLDYCSGTYDKMKFMSPAEWLTYYLDDDVQDKSKGILPFRCWQIFNEMVNAASEGDAVRFVTAAGVLSHYVGDACQPLHISYMFDGVPQPDGTKKGDGVHSIFETKMINKYIGDILPDSLDMIEKKKMGALLDLKNGKEVAGAIVTMMKKTFKLIPPKTLVDIVEKHKDESDSYKAEKMWEKIPEKSAAEIFAYGSYYLASIWQSAWKLGKGGVNILELDEVDTDKVVKTYESQDFIPSVNIKEIAKYLTKPNSINQASEF